MSEELITKAKSVNAKHDWSRADAMTEEQIHAAAVSDPDCPPATADQLARGAFGRSVRVLRQRLALNQEDFAERFGLPIEAVRGWEQGKHTPDFAAKVLLKVIEHNPGAVEEALRS